MQLLFQECESEGANKMIGYLRDLVSKSKAGEKYGKFLPKICSCNHHFSSMFGCYFKINK